MYRSAERVIDYLQKVDPEAADRVRRRYAALDHVSNAETYGYEVAVGLRQTVIPGDWSYDDVRILLAELRWRFGRSIFGIDDKTGIAQRAAGIEQRRM